jgi:putative PepSY-like beta-lactamase-inhibitor
MKLKILVLLAGLALMVSCGPSYKVTTSNGIQVPAGTVTVFTTQYPTASNVVWSAYDVNAVPIDWELTGWPELTTDDYVVRFNMDNSDYYAWYDNTGAWIGTAMIINDYKSLPASINTMLSRDYSGYSITSVKKEMKKDNMAYELQMTNGTSKIKLLVDQNGNVIKKKEKQ